MYRMAAPKSRGMTHAQVRMQLKHASACQSFPDCVRLRQDLLFKLNCEFEHRSCLAHALGAYFAIEMAARSQTGFSDRVLVPRISDY